MIGLRYAIRLLITFVYRFRLILVAGTVVGIALFLLSSSIIIKNFSSVKQRIAVVGGYHSLELPNSITSLIGEGLTHTDSQGIAQPLLAESWEALDKGRVWRFTLKAEQKWQDGSAIVAGNISYFFDDVTVERIDAKTLEFRLKDPFSPFPSVVAKPVFKKGLLGSGEWSVDKITINSGIVNQLILKDSKNNQKIFKFYPTVERAKNAFQLGQVDEIFDLPDSSPFEDKSWSETTQIASTEQQNRLVGVFFNLSDPILADKKVRQALSYAINKDEFSHTRAISVISPSSWAYNPQTKPYDFDSTRSAELISSSNLSQEQQKQLQVNLTTTPLLLDVAEKIKKDWEKVGVKTNIQVASTGLEEYQAYLAIYDIPTDPDQYSMWHSTQEKSNITKYKSARIDKLLEEGRQELDQNKRKLIYFDFQRFLLEDSPVAILYHPMTYLVKRK